MEQGLDKEIPKEIKKIDRWVNYVVHHTYIKTAVFIVAFLEAIITPLLPEIVVAGILSYRKDVSWKILSLVSALGSLTGTTLLYLSGKFLYVEYQNFFDNILGGEKVSYYIDKVSEGNIFFATVVASITPFPDRIFALISGIASFSFVMVTLGFFVGRLLRVSVVAYLSFKYGEDARKYMVKNTRYLILGILVLVAGYIIYRMFIN